MGLDSALDRLQHLSGHDFDQAAQVEILSVLYEISRQIRLQKAFSSAPAASQKAKAAPTMKAAKKAASR
jgi:hypothetical protein